MLFPTDVRTGTVHAKFFCVHCGKAKICNFLLSCVAVAVGDGLLLQIVLEDTRLPTVTRRVHLAFYYVNSSELDVRNIPIFYCLRLERGRYE